MLTRLNLAEVHCDMFTLRARLKLSPELAEKIAASTQSHMVDGHLQGAVYAMRYEVDDIGHAVKVNLRRMEDEYHLEFEYFVKRMPAPPRTLKSPRNLIRLLNEAPQELIVDSSAHFLYKRKCGWKSMMELPSPLQEGGKRGFPFTHMESVGLSRRVGEEVLYSVYMCSTDSGDIFHHVSCSLPWSRSLGPKISRHLLLRSSKLSNMLVRKERGVDDAS